MTSLARAVSMMLFVAATTSLAAQPSGGPAGRPGRAPMPRGPMGGVSPIGSTADFLLARTGALSLTDAQVVRLAAISRRTDARRKSMMTRMDSVRAATPAAGDSTRRRGRGLGFGGPSPADMKQMQQMREQMHTDVRDAIAVLTPDQQATAWMMIASGPTLGGGGGVGPTGAGFDDGPANAGQPPDRGPIRRPPAPRDVPRRPEGTERAEP